MVDPLQLIDVHYHLDEHPPPLCDISTHLITTVKLVAGDDGLVMTYDSLTIRAPVILKKWSTPISNLEALLT